MKKKTKTNGKKSNSRKDVASYLNSQLDNATNKPFEGLLSKSFVNLRGEVCNNLDSSKSKVAVQLRYQAAAREEINEVTSAIADVTKNIDSAVANVRKARFQRDLTLRKGLNAQRAGGEFSPLFKAAGEWSKSLREAQESIKDYQHELKRLNARLGFLRNETLLKGSVN